MCLLVKHTIKAKMLLLKQNIHKSGIAEGGWQAVLLSLVSSSVSENKKNYVCNWKNMIINFQIPVTPYFS